MGVWLLAVFPFLFIIDYCRLNIFIYYCQLNIDYYALTCKSVIELEGNNQYSIDNNKLKQL